MTTARSVRGRRRRIIGIVLQVTVPITLVGIWWVWTAAAHSYYFPSVPKIMRSFNAGWLGTNVVPSVVRLAIGYVIALTAGLLFGTVLGLSRVARRATSPVVEFLRAIPAPALIPFGILVFGLGSLTKVFLIAFVSIWPILLNTIDGVAGVDPLLHDVSRVFDIPLRTKVRKIVLPAAAPQVFAGARTSLALSIIIMVISEMEAAQNGIGFFILQAQSTFAISDMWAGMVVLGLLGYVLNSVFVLVEKRVLRWQGGARATGEV